MTMTAGSLFSGIGGLDLGLERAGMEIRWQVEIDEFCRKVLEKHWPRVKRYGDIRELQGTELEPVDLICGGFPCQPHSLAGKRKGSQDERDLWSEFARIIREVRPRWILAENVPGLLSSENGRFFGRVLRDLAACGYDAEWDCIPAAAFGAPHIRERVFIVAYASSFRCETHQTVASGSSSGKDQRGLPQSEGSSHNVAYATSLRRISTIYGKSQENQTWGINKFAASRTCLCILNGRIEREGWWISEPDVGRVAYGVPNRVHRLRALGNAVVPQVAEWIGRRIMEAETGREA